MGRDSPDLVTRFWSRGVPPSRAFPSVISFRSTREPETAQPVLGGETYITPTGLDRRPLCSDPPGRDPVARFVGLVSATSRRGATSDLRMARGQRKRALRGNTATEDVFGISFTHPAQLSFRTEVLHLSSGMARMALSRVWCSAYRCVGQRGVRSKPCHTHAKDLHLRGQMCS